MMFYNQEFAERVGFEVISKLVIGVIAVGLIALVSHKVKVHYEAKEYSRVISPQIKALEGKLTHEISSIDEVLRVGKLNHYLTVSDKSAIIKNAEQAQLVLKDFDILVSGVNAKADKQLASYVACNELSVHLGVMIDELTQSDVQNARLQLSGKRISEFYTDLGAKKFAAQYEISELKYYVYIAAL